MRIELAFVVVVALSTNGVFAGYYKPAVSAPTVSARAGSALQVQPSVAVEVLPQVYAQSSRNYVPVSSASTLYAPASSTQASYVPVSSASTLYTPAPVARGAYGPVGVAPVQANVIPAAVQPQLSNAQLTYLALNTPSVPFTISAAPAPNPAFKVIVPGPNYGAAQNAKSPSAAAAVSYVAGTSAVTPALPAPSAY